MKKTKPIFLVDDTIESQETRNMLFSKNNDFIEYDIKKFGGSCCVDIFLQSMLLALLHQKEYSR
jgi:hypothetical protein